jgi:hypothetical protein
VWSGGATFVLLKLVSAFVPFRVSREHESEGLDILQHGEAFAVNSPSKYLFPALPVGMIMSGVCHACVLGRCDQALGATE